MWMRASIRRRRKTSSTFFLRTSSWWCSMSLGFSRKGRRSIPTRWVSVWSSFASALPRLPAMPVMATVCGRGNSGSAGAGAGMGPGALPEDVGARLQPPGQERRDGPLDLLHLLRQHRVLVVGRALEPHRLAEPQAVAGGQREGQDGRRDGEVGEGQQPCQRLQVEEGRGLLL